MDLSASDIIRKLKPRATIVASVGHGRVRPAEYLSPIAQVISNTPARSKACQAFICRIALVSVCSLLALVLVTCVKWGARWRWRLRRDKTALSYLRAWLLVGLRVNLRLACSSWV